MKKTMLVIDDGLMNREILKNLFHEQFNVLEAKTGEEALELVEEHQNDIDIVLLDLVMPGMSGMDVLEKRQHMEYFKRIPVIVITSSDNVEDQVAAFERGANDFVSKPFIPQVVATRINNVLASRQQFDQIEREAKQLKMKSEQDEMTGLLNKATTHMTIHNILKEQTDALHVLLIIDLDNFKTVNDTLGHQEGDRVIQTIAMILNSQFRKTDVIGRIGGDEFCVLVKDVPTKAVVYREIDELLQLMRYKPGIAIPGYVSLSIGMATNEDGKIAYEELLKRADAALYQAKRGGKARYREYGVESVTMENDDRQTVAIVSTNRNVLSVAHAVIPSRLRMIEVSSVIELARLREQDKSSMEMVFVDVSECEEAATTTWKRMQLYTWISMERVFAICREGCRKQYMNALRSGVADLFFVPFEVECFKNRIERIIERCNILEPE